MKKFLIKLAVNLAVSFAVFFATLLTIEFVLRAVHYEPPAYVTQEKYRQVGWLYMPNSTALWCGNLGRVMDFENTVTTNSESLHDTEHSFEKKAGVYRILCLGDSYVEAFQVPLEKAFFKQLEKELNMDPRKPFGGKKIEMIAIGHSGYGAIQEAAELSRLGLKYSPDLVLVFLTTQNDFKDDLFRLFPIKDPQAPDTSGIYAKLLLYDRLQVFKRSFLNRWLAFKIVQWSEKKEIDRQNREAFAMDMAIYEKPGAGLFDESRQVWQNAVQLTLNTHKKMSDDAASHQARYASILIDNPSGYQMEGGTSPFVSHPEFKGKLDFTIPATKAKDFFGRSGVPCLDLSDGFGEFYRNTHKPTHFVHDGHWNEQGHRLVAELLEDYLVRTFGEKTKEPGVSP